MADKPAKKKPAEADEEVIPRDEALRRMNKALKRALNTPPCKHADESIKKQKTKKPAK